ncbi:MAG: hypothetical protein AAF389_09300 [Gemmatimonadota bacterium]
MKALNVCTALILTAAATACAAGSGAPALPPSGEVLDRLQSNAQLDQARLACAQLAVGRSAERLPDVLPSLRMARWGSERVPSEHARSVQDLMRNADDVELAGRILTAALQSAAYHDENGEPEEAIQASTWGHDALTDTNARGLTIAPAPARAAWWSDEQVEAYREYASVRLFEGAESPRGLEIEEMFPDLRDEYATALLATYQDPNLVCSG